MRKNFKIIKIIFFLIIFFLFYVRFYEVSGQETSTLTPTPAGYQSSCKIYGSCYWVGESCVGNCANMYGGWTYCDKSKCPPKDKKGKGKKGKGGGGNAETNLPQSETNQTSSESTSTNNQNNNQSDNLGFTPPASNKAGKEDLCESLVLSKETISTGETLTLTANAKNSDIKKFTFEFFNLDNIVNKKPKPIGFTGENPFVKTLEFGMTKKTASISINFSDLDKPDINWNYYMPRPKNIWVEVYFTNSNNKVSKYDLNCGKKIIAKTVDPTPTINPACICQNDNKCTSVCFFDKFNQIKYSNPLGCKPIAEIYKSSLAKDIESKWCRYYYRTKGDADGDGKANLTDYFYFKQAQYGGKLPEKVTLDFDGNNLVDSSDLKILLKSLKP